MTTSNYKNRENVKKQQGNPQKFLASLSRFMGHTKYPRQHIFRRTLFHFTSCDLVENEGGAYGFQEKGTEMCTNKQVTLDVSVSMRKSGSSRKCFIKLRCYLKRLPIKHEVGK